MADYKGALKVIISIPKGVELAEKTFNPRLGIVGGISVLGTSGVVDPMSRQALLDTIRLELNMRHAQNSQIAAVSPGNYGLDFMKETYGYDLDASVKCSNFIGETIDMAVECVLCHGQRQFRRQSRWLHGVLSFLFVFLLLENFLSGTFLNVLCKIPLHRQAHQS